MNIKEIINVTGGKLICGDENFEVENFEIDTRKINKKDVFVAITKDGSNGNKYYKQAIEKGAVCMLTEEPEEKVGNIILVKDSVKALQELAIYKRSKYDIPVVAITGSVGKTSTKDMVASVMSKKFNVLKTLGNYNNELGLPITILRLRNENALVVEMGMNHFGEISTLTKIAKPNLAVITNIGTAHIGNLGSRENILKAKLEILEGLQGKSVIINNDNNLLSKWAKEDNKYDVITYGIENKQSSYVAENIKSYEDKSTFELEGKTITVPVGGEHFVLNSLCAIAVGRYFGMSLEKIQEGIEDLELTKKRMEINKTKLGAIVINDSYNANYDSMKAAIEYLEKIENRRKIAVLGDMLELGEYSEELHRKVGDLIKNVDVLITVGNLAKYISENAKISNKIIVNSNEEAISRIKDIIQENDAILLKASNSMNFSQIADSLKEV